MKIPSRQRVLCCVLNLSAKAAIKNVNTIEKHR